MLCITYRMRILRCESVWSSRGWYLHGKRNYRVIGIESSCDDSCVAVLDREGEEVQLRLQERNTLDSVATNGIVPTKAFVHHQQTVPRIVRSTIKQLTHQECTQPTEAKPPLSLLPDLVCATRGPGMVGSLSAGLDLAKGLALAWNVPFVGVHHMLGHLLTARYEATSQGKDAPSFPFVSLLVSGGHTVVVLSRSVFEHEILGETLDIAAGDAIDRSAAAIGLKANNLGRELEKYAGIYAVQRREMNFSATPEDIFKQARLDYDLDLPRPLSKRNKKTEISGFSFSCFESAVVRGLGKLFPQYAESGADIIPSESLPALAYQIQFRIFEHIVLKLKLILTQHRDKIQREEPLSVIVSGGCAANSFLREYLNTISDLDLYELERISTAKQLTSIKDESHPEYRRLLEQQSQLPDDTQKLQFWFSSSALCSDNAVMIAWAGVELFEMHKWFQQLSQETQQEIFNRFQSSGSNPQVKDLRLVSDISVLPKRKWPLDELHMHDWRVLNITDGVSVEYPADRNETRVEEL